MNYGHPASFLVCLSGAVDLEDLGSRLRQLANIASGAPLLTVLVSEEELERLESYNSNLHRRPQAAVAGEDWEFV